MDALTKFFFDIAVECPYGRPFTAVYRQSVFGPLPDELMEFFWNKGYAEDVRGVFLSAYLLKGLSLIGTRREHTKRIGILL